MAKTTTIQFSSTAPAAKHLPPKYLIFSIRPERPTWRPHTCVTLLYSSPTPTPESGPLDLSRISAYASRSTHYI